MKHIKLWEQWQSLNMPNHDSDEGSDDREYKSTLDKFLTWAIGSEWRNSWDWMEDSMMINDEYIERNDCIGYLELFKKNSDLEIEIDSQNLGGQVMNEWVIDDVVFTLVTAGWPFSEDDDVTDEEYDTYIRLMRDLGDKLEKMGSNQIDLIDFIKLSAKEGDDLDQLTAIGFGNWLNLQRSGAN